MASIHAEVPNDCDVERTHEIIDHIEREAMRRMGILLVIHMDRWRPTTRGWWSLRS